MLALTTLVVGVILSMAMLRMVTGYSVAEDSKTRKQGAMNLAEAGISQAYWQVHYNKQALPYTSDLTIGSGSVHIAATDDGNRENSTMLITSTGSYNGQTYSASRVSVGLLPYHYCLCENRDLNEGDALISTGSGLGMRSNSLIKLDSASTRITNGAWAVGTITTNGSVSPKNASNPPIAFPAVDYNRYYSLANRIYLFDTTFWSLNYAGANVVILVYGDVYVSGTYNGICTVVSTGNIYVIGSLTKANSSSFLALVTTHKVYIDSSAANVQAVMYTHKSDNSGLVEMHGVKSITGSAAGDNFTADQTVTFTYDSGLDLQTMRQLHLPGL